MPNIAIVWDFDKTLTPQDSTTEVVEFFTEGHGEEFWKFVKKIGRIKESETWEHILASDAPTWMFALSEFAREHDFALDKNFFSKFIVPKISLYNNVPAFLKKIKELSKKKAFQEVGLEVHHFVVSAGLKDLIEGVFPRNLIKQVFGCRYQAMRRQSDGKLINFPVFCMDETMKTRSLFEISKGSFDDEKKSVNARVEKHERFVPFENMIYIGDSDTDVPSLALTKKNGGTGIIVYAPKMDKKKREARLCNLRTDKRADLITPADFSLDGELFKYISARCKQIRQRYEAEAV